MATWLSDGIDMILITVQSKNSNDPRKNVYTSPVAPITADYLNDSLSFV